MSPFYKIQSERESERDETQNINYTNIWLINIKIFMSLFCGCAIKGTIFG